VTGDTLPATVRGERVLATLPDRAYDAWLDEAMLAGFICPDGSAQVTIDPRVGGEIRIVMIFPDGRSLIEGEYITLDRPERISFSWRSPSSTSDSVVTVTFAPHGAGGTLMTIVHSQLPPDVAGRYDSGWAVVATQLAAALDEAKGDV
jgi:uncharacterized protein YndB with AHSA1/START domain